MKRLADYSPKNQQLILQQCPNAKLLAGAQEWQRLGAKIKPGARPIEIWAPDATPGKKATYFVKTLIYDISQVEF